MLHADDLFCKNMQCLMCTLVCGGCKLLLVQWMRIHSGDSLQLIKKRPDWDYRVLSTLWHLCPSTGSYKNRCLLIFFFPKSDMSQSALWRWKPGFGTCCTGRAQWARSQQSTEHQRKKCIMLLVCNESSSVLLLMEQTLARKMLGNVVCSPHCQSLTSAPVCFPCLHVHQHLCQLRR